MRMLRAQHSTARISNLTTLSRLWAAFVGSLHPVKLTRCTIIYFPDNSFCVCHSRREQSLGKTSLVSWSIEQSINRNGMFHRAAKAITASPYGASTPCKSLHKPVRSCTLCHYMAHDAECDTPYHATFIMHMVLHLNVIIIVQEVRIF